MYKSVIERIWERNLVGMFFVFVFLLETTLGPTNETPSLDGQTIAKLLFFYGTIPFTLARFRSNCHANRRMFLLFGYLGLISISSVWSANSITTLAYSAIWFAFVFLSMRLVEAGGSVERITKLFYLCLLTICTLSLLGYVFRLPSMMFAEQTTDTISVNRLKGITGGPNSLGNISGLLLIFSSYYFFVLKRKGLHLFSLLVALLTMFLSFSRTSILTAFICCLLLNYRWLRRPLVRCLVLVMMIATCLFYFSKSNSNILSAVTKSGDSEEISTLTGRTAIWIEAVRKIKESPILGGGLGSARWIMADCKFEYGRVYTTAHNLVLEELIETGVIGLALLVMLIGALLYDLVRRQRIDYNGNVIYLCVLIYLLLIGISEKSIAGTFSIKSAAFILVLLYSCQKKYNLTEPAIAPTSYENANCTYNL